MKPKNQTKGKETTIGMIMRNFLQMYKIYRLTFEFCTGGGRKKEKEEKEKGKQKKRK